MVSYEQALGSVALHAVQDAQRLRLDPTSRGDTPIPPSRTRRRPKQALDLGRLDQTGRKAFLPRVACWFDVFCLGLLAPTFAWPYL